LKFLENRNNPDAFEPVPTKEVPQAAPVASTSQGPTENYSVSVDGKVYDVVVGPSGSVNSVESAKDADIQQTASVTADETLNAPLAGNVFKVLVNEGDQVEAGDVVIVMEAMKMETEIRAVSSGEIVSVDVREGDSVAVGDTLLSLA
jgi:oxaloacetate decarboxylase alpha subunit